MKCLIIAVLLVASSWAANVQHKKSFSAPGGRIIGGEDAAPGQYPHQISLQVPVLGHTCGGSIIAESWVLTSAHCVDGQTASSLTVAAGSNLLHNGAARYPVLEVHLHENWDPWNIENDVAVLKTDPITIGGNVAIIEPDNEETGVGESAEISGWGIDSSGVIPNNLQRLDVKVIGSSQCADQEICTETPGQGICFGDSGGPLIRTVDGVRKQIGVASWVYTPCASLLPDGYARVSYYYDWIKNTCNCL